MSAAIFRAFLVVAICVAVGWGQKSLSAGENPFGFPEEAIETEGSIVLGGGGRLPDAVYDEFVRLAGGHSARIVLVPSAYPYDNMAHIKRAFGGWSDYRLKSFTFLHTDSPTEANDDDFIEPLKNATGVWFTGGAQGRLAYRYAGTKFEREVRGVLCRGGVVGGTSAGASILSRTMIRAGSSSAAVLDTGLDILTHTVVDSHYMQRNRHSRMLDLVEYHPRMIGLGVNENTAAILKGGTIRVMGESTAHLCLTDSDGNPEEAKVLEDGEECDVSELSGHSHVGATAAR